MSTRLATGLTETRFRSAREGDWLRLEGLLDRIERGKLKALSDDDLFALPVLYRAALSSLSVARETSLDRELVRYLEALAMRAYFVTYAVRAPLRGRIVQFFMADWPAAVMALRRELAVSVLLMIAGMIVAWILVVQDPAWFYAIIPQDLAGGRDPTASTASLLNALGGSENGFLGLFATFLFTHNAQIAIMSFALGAAFGLPTLLLIVYNGCMVGAFMALYASRGLGLEMAGWLSIHGTTELFAIAIAGAAGLRIGMAVAFPGRLDRLTAATRAGRVAGLAMIGVVLMLFVAGGLEGIGRQVVTATAGRFAIGGAALVGWLAYFFGAGRARHG